MSGNKANGAKRLKVVGIAVMGLALLAGAMAAWSNWPRWQTYTFPSEPVSGASIAIDYPDGWKPNTTDLHGNKAFKGMQAVAFRPFEQTGMALWWREYILRQKTDRLSQPAIAAMIWRNMPTTIDQAEQGWRMAGSNFKKLKVIRTIHALGPALDIEAQIDIPARLGMKGRAASPRRQIGMHYFAIYPRVSRLPEGMCLSLSCNSPVNLYARTDAQFRAMVGRVRLVDAAPHP